MQLVETLRQRENDINRAIDLGLPFFFGRKVYIGRSGSDTPAGPGPYFAW